MAQRPPISSELDALAAQASAAPPGTWRKQEGGGLHHFTLRGAGTGEFHLYAPTKAGEAITRLLDAARADMPRLVAEVQRLRTEVEALQSERAQRAATPAAALVSPRPVAESQDIDDDAALALAAPFHVGPKEMRGGRKTAAGAETKRKKEPPDTPR